MPINVHVLALWYRFTWPGPGAAGVCGACLFLALLDSVSRAHGMGLLSVVRPSVRPSVCGIDYL